MWFKHGTMPKHGFYDKDNLQLKFKLNHVVKCCFHLCDYSHTNYNNMFTIMITWLILIF
jgi:hypothetical protein